MACGVFALVPYRYCPLFTFCPFEQYHLRNQGFSLFSGRFVNQKQMPKNNQNSVGAGLEPAKPNKQAKNTLVSARN